MMKMNLTLILNQQSINQKVYQIENIVENKLEDFKNDKDTYAKFLIIHKIPGNLQTFSSTQSEQNHSSVLSNLNNGKHTHNYLSEPYTLIKV